MDRDLADETYQNQALPHVSRTFALTIPQLPEALRSPVTNAYLLCRIADTIEDEPAVSPPETIALMERFKEAVAGRADAAALVRDLVPLLSDSTLPAERDLVLNTERVIAVLQRFDAVQRNAIIRCVELMCFGMPRFQFNASLRGLATTADLDDYCYYVAGVVGEMLTELFCHYSTDIAAERRGLEELAQSFAQGLQMTNILKDFWEDRRRGACWFPQSVFTPHGVDLAQVTVENHDARFAAGLEELIGIAHAHLRNALDYTLLIPPQEAGIRRFLLWAVGLAVLTLRKLHANPGYTSGVEVKVTRRAVGMTRISTDIGLRHNWLLRSLFAAAARGLPLAELTEIRKIRVMADQAPAPAAAHTGTYGSVRR